MTEQNDDNFSEEQQARMAIFMAPVEQAVRNVETTEDLLMLASVMTYKARQIFDALVGEDARRKILKDVAEGRL